MVFQHHAAVRLRLLAAAATLCTLLSIASGHEPADPVPISPQRQHQPTPLPDRIVLTWSGDPASTQDVTWRTDSSVTVGLVEFAVAQPGPSFEPHALRARAVTTPFQSDLGTCHYHSLRMENLTPDTKYVYRVGDGVNWSEWFHFQTASADPKPFSFVYFGDAQNDIRAHWSRVIREAHADAPRASFLLHAGDLVNSANRDAEWGEWFGAGGWLNAMTPSIATPGNHEYQRGLLGRRTLSRHWRPGFSFPTNGPDGLEETAYWMDYQGVRIISLNSNEQLEKQAEWLEGVLSAGRPVWTIVTFHHPVFSTAQGRDNPELRQLWKPILDKHGVDLVLQGHDHTYGRTGLDVPENLATGINTRSGRTVYVVSVSGPKMYEVEPRDFMKRTASGVQLYQIIHIDAQQLDYEARLATGELYDAFTLRKRDQGGNELVEHIPETPELRK